MAKATRGGPYGLPAKFSSYNPYPKTIYIYIYTKDQDGTMRKTVSYMVQRKGLLIHDVMQTWGLSNLYIYIYILRSYDKNVL